MNKINIFNNENQKLYNDFPSFFKKLFSQRVQKLSINSGFTCPNRDGTKSLNACSYCNNLSFRPFYCEPKKTITEQINEGIKFFSKKYPNKKYLAYFQSFTNTYADISILKEKYEEAISHKSIIGLVIGTRPDCVEDEILNYLSNLAKKYFISIEYGIESTKNETLKFINRCHTFEESKDTIMRTYRKKNIYIGAHLIIGLPNENEIDILNHAKEISKLPINFLKLHQLQIIKGTKIENQFRNNPEIFLKFSLESYINFLINFLEILNPYIIIERFVSQSPRNLLISPRWGLKNFEIIDKIKKKLKEKNTWQGKFF